MSESERTLDSLFQDHKDLRERLASLDKEIESRCCLMILERLAKEPNRGLPGGHISYWVQSFDPRFEEYHILEALLLLMNEKKIIEHAGDPHRATGMLDSGYTLS